MPKKASIKTYNLDALENERIKQGWTHAQLADLAHLKNRWVSYELLSPQRRAQKKRQYLYLRKPLTLKKIALVLGLKEDDYIKVVDSPPAPQDGRG